MFLFLRRRPQRMAHAQGQEPSGTDLDVDALANVQTEAIDFMLPRTLEAVTAGQLAMWGLGGLTSIDPKP